MQNNVLTGKTSIVNDASKWFDEMVSSLRFDEQLFHNDIMDAEKKALYNKMIDGNAETMSVMARELSTTYFISNLLNDYVAELLVSKKFPKQLGLEMSESKILVWAEIYNDDEETENVLILSQAKLNSRYSKFGFHISSTIIEERDLLDVPSHYTKVSIPSR
ncbi:hypothetical protein [Flavobacterium sp.]|uniref:hypothetical protein n=1 Tax=Flavobacterium sp. TaxID=239 RepID=UPI00375365A5